MLPKEMTQKYWDILFEVSVQSNLDDSIYVGKFFDEKTEGVQIT